jgi:hypothetical protein
MDHPYFERIALETEVPVDLPDEPFDPGVRADGPAAATNAVRADESRAEPFLVRAPHEAFDRTPVRAFDPLQ